MTKEELKEAVLRDIAEAIPQVPDEALERAAAPQCTNHAAPHTSNCPE